MADNLTIKNHLNAVVTQLIADVTGLDTNRCQIQPPPGMPPFGHGIKRFIAVVPMRWFGSRHGQTSIDERYGMDIVCTWRTTHISDKDLISQIYFNTSKGVETTVRAIITSALTNAEAIIGAANANLTGADLINEPFLLSGISGPDIVGPAWFHADPEAQKNALGEQGWKMVISFDGARRIQRYGSAE